MSTRIEFRWPDELVAAVDKARGSEPRSAFVRRHIEQRVKVPDVAGLKAAAKKAQEDLETSVAWKADMTANPVDDIKNATKPGGPLSFDPSDAL
jgi:formate-dependent nitrite reductase cytochrome c552 subunit